ncbi:MAG: hypothetical protein AAGL98_11780, partial [Planctomycetota bacterium]
TTPITVSDPVVSTESDAISADAAALDGAAEAAAPGTPPSAEGDVTVAATNEPTPVTDAEGAAPLDVANAEEQAGQEAEREAAVAEALRTPERPRRGLAALFKRKEPTPPPVAVLDAETSGLAALEEQTSTDLVDEVAAAPAAEIAAASPDTPRGLAALFSRRRPIEQVGPESAAVAPVEPQLAALTPDSQVRTDAATPEAPATADQPDLSAAAVAETEPPASVINPRTSKQSRRSRRVNDARLAALPSASDAISSVETPRIDKSARLAFGEVGTVCGLRGRALGQEVARVPETGKPLFRIFDTAPSSSGQRTFHVTGFRDGCARRVTGAHAMFGGLHLYEVLHYGGGGGAGLEKATTDKTYARLRRSVCRGAGSKPCSEADLRRLEGRAAFVNVFADLGRGKRLVLLLDRGRLA